MRINKIAELSALRVVLENGLLSEGAKRKALAQLIEIPFVSFESRGIVADALIDELKDSLKLTNFKK